MEEAALLGTQAFRCNPSESMDEVELKNIQLSFPSSKTLLRGQGVATEERVDTKFGSILVGIQGDRSKPAILTYHDLGLNYISNFQAFFNFVDMRLLLQNFCIYHVNAPGQEEGAATLSDTYVYPTMDELAEQVYDVVCYYGLKRVIGLGIGAGANILCRFALAYPDKIDALCVVNCLSTQTGWIEWGYQKLNARNLRSKGAMTQGVLDYLMWHHFGNMSEERNHDLTHVYRQYFESQVNPANLGLFIDSYIRRTDLDITRELDPLRKADVRTIRAPILNVTGALSPHVDDTVTFNGRLDPVNSTWMKIQDCGMVLEEQPAKLAEAFRLFLQGQGYVPCLSTQKIEMNRKMSVDSGAGCSSAGSSGSLNVFTTPKLQPTSGVLINLSSEQSSIPEAGRESPGSSDSGLTNENESLLDQGVKNIHITENPISHSKEELDSQNNPKC